MTLLSIQQLELKYPTFVKQVKESDFEFDNIVEVVTNERYIAVTLVDEFGLKYIGYISDSYYEFDIDMFEYIG